MKKIFSIVLACTALASCVDTVILPDNKTVDEDFWQTKAEVQSVVYAAYAQLQDEAAIKNLIVWGDYRSDELYYTSSLPQSAAHFNDLQQMYAMQIDTKNAFLSWTPFYSCINYCNLVLEKAEAVVSNDPEYDYSDYLVNVAQVKALRAYCYFTLMKTFHDVPVTTKVLMNASDEFNIPQSTPAEVMQMCIDDLNSVVNQAPANNAFKVDAFRNRGVMNRDAINALLADIYLWRASVTRSAADYQACVDCCQKVIDAKKAAGPGTSFGFGGSNPGVEKDYYLSEYYKYYEDIFGSGNAQESIFELQNAGANKKNDGMFKMYYGYNNAYSNGYGYLKASKAFGKLGDIWSSDQDYRLFDFVEDANSDKEQYAIRKFIATASANGKAAGRVNRGSFNQNWIIYRLTDVMLMKAEALVQLAQNLTDDIEKEAKLKEAYDLCIVVYDRALPDDMKSTGATPVPPSFAKVKDNLEEWVLKERARELCFEGKRWYDLMRYNYRHTAQQADPTKHIWENSVPTSDEFLALALSKYAAPTSMRSNTKTESNLYLPISQDEMDLNNTLVQNPSYKATSKK